MAADIQVNGPSSKYIDTIDRDDPEYIRQMQRPADVKEDMHQMEHRKRVDMVLNSQAFREELEKIIEEQLSSGQSPASLVALQQISELLLPITRGGHARGLSGASPVIPINDIRGADLMDYSKVEKITRCKLAALYRLVDLFGWNHGIYAHITARITQEHEHFLLNPFGMLYSEVTASSLVKLDMQGEIVDPGTSTLGINKAGYTLHSAIHQARPDIRCVIHLHTPHTIAVSAMKCGLLPLSQEALICGNISYHDYNGIVLGHEEVDKLSRNLGPINKVLFLRNHGIIACGTSIAEAYHYAFNVMTACDTQMLAIPAGIDNLVLVDEETRQKAFSVGSQGGGGVDTGDKKWKPGELEFEALMRQLDNAGFRTGYMYRHPIMKSDRSVHTSTGVEIPPTSSSLPYYMEGDYNSPIKAALDRQKKRYKTGWLSSPNTYVKKEIDEIGTDQPKKITKWVEESGDATHGSSPVKVDDPNLFAPQGDNPKEFKNKQKQLKKDYYEEKINAGPQSKILEGISWDEAQRMKDGTLSGTSDSVITVGAASKGIIQRDQQHNVIVYKSTYAPNPFVNVSEDDLETYKRDVEKKDDDLSPGPDGHLISSDERMQHLRDGTELALDYSKSEEVSVVVSSRDTDVMIGHEDGVVNGVRDDDDHTHGRYRRNSRETNLDDFTSSPVPIQNVHPVKRRSKETLIDDVVDNRPETKEKPRAPPRQKSTSSASEEQPVHRSESARHPQRNKELIDELQRKNVGRSHSERRSKDEKPGSPTKSTDGDSADTLDDKSPEGSPTKEVSSPVKDKKKKKKFRIPSFSKKKKEKDIKE